MAESPNKIKCVFFFPFLLLNFHAHGQHILNISILNGSYQNKVESKAEMAGIIFNTKNKSTKNNIFLGLGHTFRKKGGIPFIKYIGFKTNFRINLSRKGTNFYNDSHTLATARPSFEKIKQNHVLSFGIAAYHSLNPQTLAYLQGGFLLSRWQFEGQYFNHHTKKKKISKGIFIGAGLETNISKKVTLSFDGNYEIYQSIRGKYTTFASWLVKPQIISMRASIHYYM